MADHPRSAGKPKPAGPNPRPETGDRIVALDDETVTVLRAHRKRQQTQRREWGGAWIDSGRAFARESGEPLHPAEVISQFKQLTREADLPPVRLQDLRDGAATMALAAGVDRKVVQEMLSHSSETITADTYTSVLPELQQEAAKAIAALHHRRRNPGPSVPSGSGRLVSAGPASHRPHKHPKATKLQTPGRRTSSSAA